MDAENIRRDIEINEEDNDAEINDRIRGGEVAVMLKNEDNRCCQTCFSGTVLKKKHVLTFTIFIYLLYFKIFNFILMKNNSSDRTTKI